MALNEVDPAANRSTAGGGTVFAYTFEIASKNDIEVLVDTTTKTVDVDYTVDGIGNSGGGNVTFFTAPANGTVVTRIRKQPAVQSSTYTANEGFPHSRVEADYDKLWMAIQQIREQLHRSMLLPKSSALVDQGMDVPTVGSFARGKVGGGIDWATVTSAGSITIPVPVNQGGTGNTTASGARTALDVPSNAEAILDTLINAKGDLIVGTGNDTPAIKSVGANGAVLTADSTQTDGLAYGFPHVRNPIINGNMEIWQRGLSFASVANAWTADRWHIFHSSGASLTVIQNTDVPSVSQAGVLLNYSLDLDTTVADASILAGDYGLFSHPIEGYNWRHFAQRQVTVSFWIKATRTGTYCFSLCNSGQNRTYIAEYTVNSSDTWEQKTIVIPASPSAGTWNYTNGVGVYLRWALFAGSTYQDTGASWITTATIKIATSNQVNAVDNASNIFRITGVKLELGSVATPIQYVPFEEELARCKRYYQKSFAYATAPAQNVGLGTGEIRWLATVVGAVATMGPTWTLPVEVRPFFTTTWYNPSAGNAQVRNLTDATDMTATATRIVSDKSIQLQFTGAAGNAVGEELAIHWTVDAEL